MTNTVPHEIQKMQCHKIKTVDISIMLVEAIRRIHNNESMSYLFRNIALEDWSQDIITFYLLMSYDFCFIMSTIFNVSPSSVVWDSIHLLYPRTRGKLKEESQCHWSDICWYRGEQSLIHPAIGLFFCHNKWVEISCCFIMIVS